MATYFISTVNWADFVQSISKQFITFGLQGYGKNLFWEPVTPENIETAIVSKYRAVSPVKQFFFPLKEEVTKEPLEKKVLLIGVKACDLAHLTTTDNIFLGGVMVDPYYATKRQNTVIISSDCNEYLPTCFCTNIEGSPSPSKGYDLNLTSVRGGYIVETGTAKGEDLIAQRRNLFQVAQAELIAARKAQRAKMVQSVSENNKNYHWQNPHDLVNSTCNTAPWKNDIASTCVECDACRFACGSCYCFLLGETKKLWEKARTWDSCQSCGYGRVAGGANPRKTRDERLRNFYTCKMVYRKENFGVYACTGCGRCIEVCQGKIDIRKSLEKLNNAKEGEKKNV
jgi:sulfhydrogenase subunit beta (sulfur reductase)